MTPRHSAALSTARAGYPVFPCEVNGKRPACEHGFKDATTDVDQINAWWEKADYNIGFEPDRAGWFVIDIDPRHGGEETWEHLNFPLHQIPTVCTIRTPSGGRHLYFKGSLPSSAGKLGPGVDVRGKGGYVLLPPSVIDGVEYRSTP